MNDNVPLVTKLAPAALTQSKVGNNLTMEVSMRTYSSCILIYDGKNINYYHDESTDQIIAELSPMKAKVVVDPDAHCPCNRKVEPHHNACNITREPDAVDATPMPPFASFGTLNQLGYNLPRRTDMMENQFLTEAAVIREIPPHKTMTTESSSSSSMGHRQWLLALLFFRSLCLRRIRNMQPLFNCSLSILLTHI